MKQSLSDYHPNLRIGTCSWKYDSWKGLIYDAEKDYRPYDYLQDYAKHYNTVEIEISVWFLAFFVGSFCNRRLTRQLINQ